MEQSQQQNAFKDRGVVTKDDLPVDATKIADKIIYGGWFLTLEDSHRMEQIARGALSGSLKSLMGNGDVVAECGHLTHSFCLRDKDKQFDVHRLIKETMPASIRLQISEIRYKIWGTDFIAAFVPTPTHDVGHLTTNEHPHITALRYTHTSAVCSNDMLASEDRLIVTLDEPVSLVLHAGVVVMKKCSR